MGCQWSGMKHCSIRTCKLIRMSELIERRMRKTLNPLRQKDIATAHSESCVDNAGKTSSLNTVVYVEELIPQQWGCWNASQELRNPLIRIIF